MKQFKSLREYFLNVLTVAALISEVHVAEKKNGNSVVMISIENLVGKREKNKTVVKKILLCYKSN